VYRRFHEKVVKQPRTVPSPVGSRVIARTDLFIPAS
jgi:hypothetical protein